MKNVSFGKSVLLSRFSCKYSVPPQNCLLWQSIVSKRNLQFKVDEGFKTNWKNLDPSYMPCLQAYALLRKMEPLRFMTYRKIPGKQPAQNLEIIRLENTQRTHLYIRPLCIFRMSRN
ncbi:unnamed protein product [Ixodes pacificus]